MKVLKVSKLLRKSYKIRSVADIFQNSSNLVLFHNEKYNEILFNNLRKKLAKDKIYFKLLNKDDFLSSSFSSYVKGPTVLMFFDKKIDSNELNLHLTTNKEILGDVLLLKINNFMTLKTYDFINKKYGFNSSEIMYNLVNILGNIRILFVKMVFMFKFYFFILNKMVNRFLMMLVIFSKKYKENKENGNVKSIN